MNWQKMAINAESNLTQNLEQLKQLSYPKQIITQTLKWRQNDFFKTKVITPNIGQIEYGHGEYIFAILVNDIQNRPEQVVAAYQAFKLLKNSNCSVHQRLRLIISTDKDDENHALNDYLAREAAPGASIVTANNSPYDNTTIFYFQFLPITTPVSSCLEQVNFNLSHKVQAQLLTVNWRDIHQKWFNFINYHQIQGHLDIAERQVTVTINNIPQDSLKSQQLLCSFLLQLNLDENSQNFLQVLNYLLHHLTNPQTMKIIYHRTSGGTIQVNLKELSPEQQKSFYQRCQSLSFKYHVTFTTNYQDDNLKINSNPLIKKVLQAYQTQTGIAADSLSLRPSVYSALLKNSFSFGNLLPNISQNQSSLITLTAIDAEILSNIASSK